MATSVIDSLLVELGFEYNSKELGKFKKDLGEIGGLVRGLSKQAALAAAAVTGLVTTTAKSVDEQGKLAERLGESVETLTAWEFAAQISGGTAQSLRGSFSALSKSAGEASRGVGGGVEAFGILGIEVLDLNGNIKDTSLLMSEVSSAIQGLSKQRQIDLAGKLGLSDSLMLLQLGPERIKSLTEEAKLLGVTTAEQSKLAADFNDSLVRVWAIAKRLSRELMVSLAPAVIEQVGIFTDWWKSNQAIIKQKLPEWMEKARIAATLLAVVLGGLITIRAISSIVTTIQMVKKLTSVFMALNVSALLWPVLIAGFIAAILTALEDADAFFKGQDSLIGLLIEKYPKLAEEITLVANSLKLLLDAGKKVSEFFANREDIGKQYTNKVESLIKKLPAPVAKFIIESSNKAGEFLTGDTVPITSVDSSQSRIVNIKIDGVDINVPPGANPIDIVAKQLMSNLEQASTDLNTGVDQ